MKQATTIIYLFIPIIFFSQIVVQDDGKIGIGTETPIHAVDIRVNPTRVGNSTNNSLLMGQQHTSGYAGLRNAKFSNDVNYMIMQHHQGNTYLNAPSNKIIAFRIANKDKMRLLANGDFGIGTSAPTQKLSVNGNANKTGGSLWSTFCDRKVKKNINDFTDGLEQILQINPVTYQYNGKAGISDTDTEYVGIIAQEMEKIAPYTVEKVNYKEIKEYEEYGNLKSKIVSEEDYLQYDGTAVIYMLVNAIKEQQVQINKLENHVKSLTTISDIDKVSVAKQNIKFAYDENVFLGQNSPNPFEGKTAINYYLPASTVSASILFYSESGQLIKKEEIHSFESGMIDLNADEVVSGLYTYSLEVDGKIMDTKRMIVSK